MLETNETKAWDSWKTFSLQTLHTINAFHTHLEELDFRISKFETSMMTSNYHDISHMSKLEKDIAIL